MRRAACAGLAFALAATPRREASPSAFAKASADTPTPERLRVAWAVHHKTFYLLDVWRGRLEYPHLKRKVVALQQAHGARTVLIEKAGLGLNLVQDLLADSPAGFPNPIGIVPQGDKLNRMVAESARIEAGHVVLPRDAPWLAVFLNELLAFPNGRHDDQVDSVSQFLNWAWRRATRTARVGIIPPELIELEDI